VKQIEQTVLSMHIIAQVPEKVKRFMEEFGRKSREFTMKTRAANAGRQIARENWRRMGKRVRDIAQSTQFRARNNAQNKLQHLRNAHSRAVLAA
jgi:hypothetical protein